MTQVQSNSHRVEIIAAAGSTLAALAAATTPGTWAAWPQGVIPGAITNPNPADDPIISNGLRAIWTPATKKLHYYGHGHTGHRSGMLTFDDATSTWTRVSTVPQVPLPDAVADGGLGDNSHQFGGFTGNPANGFLYFFAGNGGGGGTYIRPAGSTSWQQITGDTASASQPVAGATFNPNLGTSGSIIQGSGYGIYRLDIATLTWSTLWRWSGWGTGTDPQGDPLGPPPAGSAIAFWDPRSNAVYVGGGAVNTHMIKQPTSGTHSVVADPPARPFLGQSGVSEKFIVDGYVSTLASTTGRLRRPILIDPGVSMRSYNGIADTWTSMGIVPPSWGSPEGGIYAVIPDYDCIVYWVESGDTMNAWVFRHPLADEA